MPRNMLPRSDRPSFASCSVVTTHRPAGDDRQWAPARRGAVCAAHQLRLLQHRHPGGAPDCGTGAGAVVHLARAGDGGAGAAPEPDGRPLQAALRPSRVRRRDLGAHPVKKAVHPLTGHSSQTAASCRGHQEFAHGPMPTRVLFPAGFICAAPCGQFAPSAASGRLLSETLTPSTVGNPAAGRGHASPGR
ncbi:unnamed protein product [Phaeothamnion confervicola]